MKRNKAKAKAYLTDKPKVYQGDKALEKMGLVINKESTDKVKEQLMTTRRHLKGALISVEMMLGLNITPKCRKCYNEYGYVDKCVCNIENP